VVVERRKVEEKEIGSFILNVLKAASILPLLTTTESTLYIYIYIYIYKGKSLNNRNFILKCMENYAQQKILF